MREYAILTILSSDNKLSIPKWSLWTKELFNKQLGNRLIDTFGIVEGLDYGPFYIYVEYYDKIIDEHSLRNWIGKYNELVKDLH